MKLTIDSQEVLLGENFGTEIVFANPYFTKDGGYTLDISIDLKIPANADVYRFINRKAQHARPKNRSAVLSHAGRIIIQGTEIILSVQNSMAQIQIVSGNSELNYLSSQRKDIRDIIMPAYYPLPYTENGKYPEAYFCYPTFLQKRNSFGKEILQEYNIAGLMDLVASSFYPFPYLLHIISEVVKDAGFSVRYNYLLENPDNCCLFIVPMKGIQSIVNPEYKVDFSRMLPAWSADEFFSEIEKFFNVTFLKDSLGNYVDIVSNWKYLNGDNATVYIPEDGIVDDHEKYYEEEASYWLNYRNVSYDLPSIPYYKYADIPYEIVEKCQGYRVTQVLPTPDTMGKYYMFVNHMHGDQWMVRRPLEIKEDEDPVTTVAECMQFEHSESEDNDNVRFRIIPAQIVAHKRKVTIGSEDKIGFVSCPLIDDIDYSNFEVVEQDETPAEETDLNTDIEKGIKEDDAYNLIRVAYFNGLTSMHNDVPGSCANMSRLDVKAAQSQTHNKLIYSVRGDAGREQAFVLDGVTRNLSISYRLANEYRKNKQVDTSVKYKFKWLNKGVIYDVKNIFVFCGRKYCCKEIKYYLRTDGISDICEGEFYAYSD